MRRNSRRKDLGKERFLMAASAVLVLGSLTATGLWLGRDSQDEEYVVDLSSIENAAAAGAATGMEGTLAEDLAQMAPSDDLDYDPYFQETNSQNVENPDQTGEENTNAGSDTNVDSDTNADSNINASGNTDAADDAGNAADDAEKKSSQSAAKTEKKEEGNETGESLEEEGAQALSTAMQPALTFSDGDMLLWPVVGNILINYSMDRTVYFPTLQQYKYNPAIIIQANEGDLITAASAGKVISVFTDPQIGNGITMELGGGYEATYGQLSNILVSEGSYVAAGDVIAEVCAPTRYFSVEGTNVYFKLTKDGQPVNPMTKLS